MVKNISTNCPACENDIIISEKEMRLAIQHKAGDKVLVTCPVCCRVLILPDVPTNDAAFDQWTPDVQGEVCIPFIIDTDLRTPNGAIDNLGVKLYTSGAGVTGLSKRAYMARYGINPECYMAKNPSMGGKPFKVGR